jgi:hypothetical protein
MNTSTISITDLRKNLFRIADEVFYENKEVEVEKEGRRIMRLVKIDDDPRERARRMLKVMKRIGGKFKDVKFDRGFFRGKKEIEYMKNLGKW